MWDKEEISKIKREILEPKFQVDLRVFVAYALGAIKTSNNIWVTWRHTNVTPL